MDPIHSYFFHNYDIQYIDNLGINQTQNTWVLFETNHFSKQMDGIIVIDHTLR